MGQQRVSRLRSQQRKRMSKETRKSPPTRASEASLSGGALISFFSVYPQSRPCLCGEQSLIKIHHRGTENTEDAQRLAQTRTLPDKVKISVFCHVHLIITACHCRPVALSSLGLARTVARGIEAV